jgi:microcystin-dependent protein
MATGRTTNNNWPYPLEGDTPDVAADIEQLAIALDALSPFQTGDLKVSAVSTAPSGWLACDGSAISRSGHTALFSAIGTTYGAGDGSTTFNVPDFQGRVILGAGSGSGLSVRSRGQKGGEETHTLTAAEQADMALAGNVPVTTGSIGNIASGGGGSSVPTSTATWSSGGAVTTGGGGGAHNNVQPYGVANVFIKT